MSKYFYQLASVANKYELIKKICDPAPLNEAL